MHRSTWSRLLGTISLGALVASLAAAFAAALVAAPASATAPTIDHPGFATPCKSTNTLQACVDAAAAGATIVLTVQSIGQDVTISKSLTLKGGDRSLPSQLQLVTVKHTTGTDPVDVTLMDLSTGGIWANYDGGPGGDHLTIRRVGAGVSDVAPRGIQISAAVPVSVDVEDSYARTGEQDATSLVFDTSHPGGTSHVRFVGNRITQHGETASGAGIVVWMSGGGTTRAVIANNRVWDVAGSAGGDASGIFVYPNQHASADITVVGNTIDRVGASGIELIDAASSGHVTVNIFDNIVSHTTNGSGLSVGVASPSSLTFHAGYNDFYQNDLDNVMRGLSAGPGNLDKDPKYVDRSNGDLRLTASSPLIDRGQTCPTGGVVNHDASGHARLAGTSVDMGAYERGAGAPTGVVRLGTSGGNTLTGTSGADILCGYGGRDVLKGLGGSDYLDGGSSDDKLAGGSGSDRLLGGSGNDKLCSKDGTHGNDYANGGSGTDSGQRDSGDTQVSVEHATSC